jgi:hypothetical protein
MKNITGSTIYNNINHQLPVKELIKIGNVSITTQRTTTKSSPRSRIVFFITKSYKYYQPGL